MILVSKHPFLTGIGMGAAAGAALGMAMDPKKKEMKAAARKAVRAVEDVAGNINDAIGR